MTKYLREEGNINNFRDQKAGNKSESNFVFTLACTNGKINKCNLIKKLGFTL